MPGMTSSHVFILIFILCSYSNLYSCEARILVNRTKMISTTPKSAVTTAVTTVQTTKNSTEILTDKKDDVKQILNGSNPAETNQVNFVRLLLMRLIYGVASRFGYEDRLSSLFNGALAPPNADDDDLFGFSGSSDDDDDTFDLFDVDDDY